MAFTDKQSRALKAKLNFRHVRTRASNGSKISYVEGWHVIAEANRIFGYDAWDRTTLSPRCIWSETQRGQLLCCYSTKVRITVRAGGTITVREGIGTGMGRSPNPELAHEIALKAAETDATKRALATFGNPFGLALYDKDFSQVTRPPKPAAVSKATDPKPEQAAVTLALQTAPGRIARFTDAKAFVAAVLEAVAQVRTIDDLYAFWEANIETFRALRQLTTQPESDPMTTIVTALKATARALGLRAAGHQKAIDSDKSGTPQTSHFAFPKERRLRDKDHLAFVANQPCQICGRRPSQAHHLRFAQPRAMGLKVSDEFTVPLCNTHHDSVHKTGDERAWWARHGVLDPLKVAEKLWAASHALDASQASATEARDISASEHERRR